MHFSFKRLFCFFAIPVLALLIICLPAHAQRRYGGMNADGNLLGGSTASSGSVAEIPTSAWSIAQNTGYETPLGDFKDIYKGAPTFGISVFKRWNHLIIGGTIDYRSYTPKASSVAYPVDEANPNIIAAISYSKFTGIGAYVSAAYEVPIVPSASFYIGANLGSIFSKYSYELTVGESYTEHGGGNYGQMPYIAPKLGLNFAVSNAITVGIEARYSLKYGGGSYNSREGGSVTQGFSSAAGNLVLAYNF